MFDYLQQVKTTQRSAEITGAGADRQWTISLTKVFDSPIDDVWDAITNPQRIPRWFLPISGNLEVEGRFQLENNAGGTIEKCDPPKHFVATWEYGDRVSRIDVSLSADSDSTTRVRLRHSGALDEARWAEFGPADAGIGWDLALVGLAQHLTSATGEVDNLMGTELSLRMIEVSGDGWREANIGAGTDKAAAAAAAERTRAFYTGMMPAE
ncbi:SRPBCC family protein [Nocardia panacis]|uniref:SRPBCC family protein n=1 Tax=Nocardia panacis TaxID=2340916 RepID=UPI001EF05A55|nr:SRPBCC family protein [Nocardia panacis]